MKSIISEENLQELSFREASEINGGESLWYWIAYAAGAAAKEVVETYELWRDQPIVALRLCTANFVM